VLCGNACSLLPNSQRLHTIRTQQQTHHQQVSPVWKEPGVGSVQLEQILTKKSTHQQQRVSTSRLATRRPEVKLQALQVLPSRIGLLDQLHEAIGPQLRRTSSSNDDNNSVLLQLTKEAVWKRATTGRSRVPRPGVPQTTLKSQQ
jgi:hypothetical protein